MLSLPKGRFYISTGDKNRMYTLRGTYWEFKAMIKADGEYNLENITYITRVKKL